MTETKLLKRSASYGVRWVWFILVGFFWRLAITLSIFLVALALFGPVAMIAGGAGAVAGDVASFVVGLVALLAWPVCLGAIGYRTGIGYPRLSVNLSFHSPEEDVGGGGPNDTDTTTPTTPTDAQNEI